MSTLNPSILPKFEIGDHVMYNGMECLVSDNFDNDGVYVRLSPLDEQGKDIGVCRRDAVKHDPHLAP